MRLGVDGRADQLRRIYAATEARLQRLVTEALASGQLGEAAYLRDRLLEVQAQLAQLQAEAIPEATGTVADAYQEGIRIAAAAGRFTGVHQDALIVLADALTGRLNEAAETVGRRVEDVFRREQLRAAAVALAVGADTREAAARLRDQLVRQGVSAFVDRAGRRWGLENYCDMAVRTVTREAVSRATALRLLEAGQTEAVWISAADVDDEPCASRHGQPIDLTDPDALPPAHPRCRCVVWPQATARRFLERDQSPTLVTA